MSSIRGAFSRYNRLNSFSSDNPAKSTEIELTDIEDPSDVNGAHRRPSLFKLSKSRDGWRYGASLAMIATAFSFILNLSVLLWVAIGIKTTTPMPRVFQGSCAKAASISTGSHLLINAISTILLSGSNYCMQCLVAPTRQDVDKAHASGKTLDIGVPSMRNIWHISGIRKALWFTLLLSSLPLHLLFNSVLFDSFSAVGYYATLVRDDFDWGPDYRNAANLTNAVMQADHYGAESGLPQPLYYEVLENKDCIAAYSKDIISDRKHVYIVTSNNTGLAANSNINVNKTLLDGVILDWVSNIFENVADYSGNVDPYSWICIGDGSGKTGSWDSGRNSGPQCSVIVDQVAADSTNWTPNGFRAERCVSERVEERCGLFINPTIGWVVLVCNGIKVAVMAFIAFSKVLDDPFCTMGDAIASFIEVPDKSDVAESQEMCKPAQSVSRHWWHRPQLSSATSKSKWFWTTLYFLACIITVILLTALSLKYWVGSKSFAGLRKAGLGAPSGQALISGWALDNIQGLDGSTNAPDNKVIRMEILANILVANSPQLVFSILYFAVNSLCTSMSVTGEWSRFGPLTSAKGKPKSLRVSRLRGAQRSTYFLGLPYRFAIPLMIFTALMHWLISQSIFLAVINASDPPGNWTDFQYVKCGYSPFAMILALIVGTCLLLVVYGISFIPIDASIPLVGNSSLAISAACQLPEDTSDDDRRRLARGFLVWSQPLLDDGTVDQQRGHFILAKGDRKSRTNSLLL